MRKKCQPDYEITFDEVVFDASSGGLEIKEKPVDNRVFQIVALVGIILMAIAAVQVFLLGVGRADFFQARADANVNKILLKQAPRGLILDRFGQPLVKNNPILTLYLRPTELVRYNEFNQVVEVLGFVGVSRDELYLILSKSDLQTADTIAIKKDLSIEETIKIRGAGLLSLAVEQDFNRSFDPSFAHVVGYTGLTTKEDITEKGLTSIDLVGKSGLERYYDHILAGENGKTIIYRNSLGEEIEKRLLNEPQIGQGIITTIDAEFQQYFYERLNQGLRNLGRSKGVGLAINPLNGEILSLISLPSFKPDRIVEALNNQDKPLFNRAISGLYSPGSTIKPFWAAAALNEKLVAPTDQFLSVGYIEIPNPYFPERPTRFLDWKPHGWVNLYSAIARSSNIYFYTVAGGFENQRGLGISKMIEYFHLFGLDEKTGLNLFGENQGFMFSPAEKEKRTGQIWRIGDTYNISIGQGDMTVTPIGLLTAFSSIFNSGRLYQPRLILGEPLKIIKEYSELQPYFQEVIEGMIDAVDKPYGTSHLLNSLPIKIAAKTGSAQTGDNTKINAFWAGCGPVPFEENSTPICVLVLIEDAQEGSLNTVPIAYDVMNWYYKNRLK